MLKLNVPYPPKCEMCGDRVIPFSSYALFLPICRSMTLCGACACRVGKYIKFEKARNKRDKK